MRLPVSVDAIVPDVRVVGSCDSATSTWGRRLSPTLRNDSPVDATLWTRSAPYLSASCPADVVPGLATTRRARRCRARSKTCSG